jgi:DNA-binding protein
MNLNNGVLGESLKFFSDSLKSFVIARFKEVYRGNWIEKALNPPGKDLCIYIKKNPEHWDLAVIVSMIHDHWDHVFIKVIGKKFPKAMLTVVKHFRNQYSHQEQMSNRDIYRAIDLIEHILEKLHLSTGNLESYRQQVLHSIKTQPAQLTQPPSSLPVSCQGCNSALSVNFAFQCANCHLTSCLRCLKYHHDYLMQFNLAFSCPNCNKLISDYEKDILNLQLKYSSF